MSRDRATTKYIRELDDQDREIIHMFNQNYSDIASRLNIERWKVSDATGRYIGFLQANHTRRKVASLKEPQAVLMGKKESYHERDEDAYGMPMEQVTFFDLSHDEQTIYLR